MKHAALAKHVYYYTTIVHPGIIRTKYENFKRSIYTSLYLTQELNMGTFQDWTRISQYQKLSEEFIREHKDLVNWTRISQYQQLSEEFIIEHKDLVNWTCISEYQKLSEEFIREHKDLLNWTRISQFQQLSEEFIVEHKDLVNWNNISAYQKLSEEFICEHKDLVNWTRISIYQQLSEEFIHEHKDLVDWTRISQFQQLSEEFIHEHKDLVIWLNISQFQQLSEEFIVEHKDLVNWTCISKYQQLSEEFIKEFDITISENNNWNYVTDEIKIEKLIAGGYEVKDGYVYGYKSVRDDMYSVYNFNIRYDIGIINDWHYDPSCNNETSFGLSMWYDEEKAKEYYNRGKLLKIRAKISDVKALTKYKKVRCSQLEVIEIS